MVGLIYVYIDMVFGGGGLFFFFFLTASLDFSTCLFGHLLF